MATKRYAALSQAAPSVSASITSTYCSFTGPTRPTTASLTRGEGCWSYSKRRKVRAIGVSNFKPAHIDKLLEATGVAPHVNQVQFNPYVVRESEQVYDTAHGIVTEAWSPIGRGRQLLDEAVLKKVATRHGKTPAQVVLRWHVQQGLIPIPKSSHRRRLAENIDVFGFDLTGDDMADIAGLDRHGQGAADSDRQGH